MEYIKSNKINPVNTFFHFSRIDNRDSIEKNGLRSVAGGENRAGKDNEHKAIYFSKGFFGILKAVDVWARWEYTRYARIERSKGRTVKLHFGKEIENGKDRSYDREVMHRLIFNKMYNDFKNRQYYTMDLIEGENGDFKFGDIDIKKLMSRDVYGRPYASAVWQYGPYSDFGTEENQNNTQEDWNMNTIIGDRTITSNRLKIVETEEGKSDGLSVIIETYDRFRHEMFKGNDSMLEILDDFILYAKERYRTDNDYKPGATDYGRRTINPHEQEKYQKINKINNNKDIDI